MADEHPTQQAEKPEGPHAFANILTQLDDGIAHIELGRSVQSLMKRMREIAATNGGAKGALKLTLKFDSDAKGVVDVTYDIDVTEPKQARGKSVFWLTKGANLTPKNPMQQTLPLRSVDGPPVRTADDSNPAGVARNVE